MLKVLPLKRRSRYGLTVVLVSGLVLLSGGLVSARPNAEEKARSCIALRAMARVYMAYGDYAKAQPLTEQALTLAKTKNASEAEVCSCLLDLAYLYKHQGRLIDAEKMCDLALELQKKLYYKNHPFIAGTLKILASIYQEQAKYHQARSALDQAMSIMQTSHLP